MGPVQVGHCERLSMGQSGAGRTRPSRLTFTDLTDTAHNHSPSSPRGEIIETIAHVEAESRGTRNYPCLTIVLASESPLSFSYEAGSAATFLDWKNRVDVREALPPPSTLQRETRLDFRRIRGIGGGQGATFVAQRCK